MKNDISFNTISECRNYVNGHAFTFDHEDVTFAGLRERIRRSYPPFRGERVRRTVLGTIGILVGLVLVYCAVVAV